MTSVALLAPACDRSSPSGTRDAAMGHADAAAQRPWFVEITESTQLSFVHESGFNGKLYLPFIMGGGAAMFDYDNDDDLDIFLVNNSYLWSEPPEGKQPIHRLFRQESDGHFCDVSERSGLGISSFGMGPAVGDIDNDGDLDLFLTNFGPAILFRNRGDGTFEDITASSGVRVNGWSTAAAFFDYDQDGFLDLFVTRYVVFDPAIRCSDYSGRPNWCGPDSYPGLHSLLFRNVGNGTFADLSEAAGLTQRKAKGLGVVCEDYDQDGLLDVLVANDKQANHLWVKKVGGQFQEQALQMGVAFNAVGMAEANMGIAAADFDNDQDVDIFITHLEYEHNTYWRNDGSRGFNDVTGGTGLGPSSVPFTGFGVAAFDAEMDGDLDIYVANGRVSNATSPRTDRLPHPWRSLAEPGLFYTNISDGRFEESNAIAGALCGFIEVGRASVTGDVDNDGDIDVLVTRIEGPARLFRNDAPRRGHWLSVRAIDPRLKRDAIGARVRAKCGSRTFMRSITPASGYLGSNDIRAHFGLSSSSHVDELIVSWPDGFLEIFGPFASDQFITLKRGEGRSRK